MLDLLSILLFHVALSHGKCIQMVTATANLVLPTICLITATTSYNLDRGERSGERLKHTGGYNKT